jgi:hypothetical protein
VKPLVRFKIKQGNSALEAIFNSNNIPFLKTNLKGRRVANKNTRPVP